MAQSIADEIRAQDWSDAHNRADGARHNRNDDHTTTKQLSTEEAERVRVNVIWVVGQALRSHDPNFDIYAFAKAADVSDKYLYDSRGNVSRVLPAGLRGFSD